MKADPAPRPPVFDPDVAIELVFLFADAADRGENNRPPEFYVEWHAKAARRLRDGTMNEQDVNRLIATFRAFGEALAEQDAAKDNLERLGQQVVAAEQAVDALLRGGA